MPEVKWIKLLTGMFDDEKIKLIEDIPEADMILIIWIKLLTLAGKKNVNGYIFLTENIPYTDEMLSTIFKRPINTIRLALETFKKFDMINYDDNNIMKITNWEKHQNIEGLEKIRKLGRLRQQKFREEQKRLPKPKTKNNVTLTLGNGIDKIRIDKKREEKRNKNKIQNTNFKNLINNPIQESKKPANNIEFDFELWSWHGIDEDIKDRWAKIFPNVEIEIELMKIREYFKAHPGHEKVIEEKFKNNYSIYIFDWLARAEGYAKEKGDN